MARFGPTLVNGASIGMGVRAGVLVFIYTYREANIRIISARPAEPREISQYEGNR